MIDNHIIITPTSLNNVGNSKEIMIPRFGSKEDIINVKNPETAFSDNKKIDVKIGLKSETWDQRKQDDKEGKIFYAVYFLNNQIYHKAILIFIIIESTISPNMLTQKFISE